MGPNFRRRLGTCFNIALGLVALSLCGAALSRLHSNKAAEVDPLEQRLREVTFDKVAFSDAIDYFHRASNLEFRVDWNTIKTTNTLPTTPVSVRLRDVSLARALEEMLGTTDRELAFEVEGNIVRITTRGALPRIVRVYDVSDLLPPAGQLAQPATQPAVTLGTVMSSPLGSSGDPPTRGETLEQIATLITTTVEPDAWVSNGGTSAIWPGADRLAVVHTREGHRKVATLVRRLREANAIGP